MAVTKGTFVVLTDDACHTVFDAGINGGVRVAVTNTKPMTTVRIILAQIVIVVRAVVWNGRDLACRAIQMGDTVDHEMFVVAWHGTAARNTTSNYRTRTFSARVARVGGLKLPVGRRASDATLAHGLASGVLKVADGAGIAGGGFSRASLKLTNRTRSTLRICDGGAAHQDFFSRTTTTVCLTGNAAQEVRSSTARALGVAVGRTGRASRTRALRAQALLVVTALMVMCVIGCRVNNFAPGVAVV